MHKIIYLLLPTSTYLLLPTSTYLLLPTYLDQHVQDYLTRLKYSPKKVRQIGEEMICFQVFPLGAYDDTVWRGAGSVPPTLWPRLCATKETKDSRSVPP